MILNFCTSGSVVKYVGLWVFIVLIQKHSKSKVFVELSRKKRVMGHFVN